MVGTRRERTRVLSLRVIVRAGGGKEVRCNRPRCESVQVGFVCLRQEKDWTSSVVVQIVPTLSSRRWGDRTALAKPSDALNVWCRANVWWAYAYTLQISVMLETNTALVERGLVVA